ncbi:MAG: hypothetical protein ACFB0E_05050 [Leptolyngbyaceae cyanobacterium]
MNLPVIVDIAIGLTFIYLLLSLLASEIQELIATILQWRAKHLKDSITNLFAGDAHSQHSVDKAHQLARQVYQHPLVRSINQESRGFLPTFFRSITWLISRSYRWLIRRPEGVFGDRRTAPSYIPREAFATALLEQLGSKYFVERLVEAKFADFVASLLARISACKGMPEQLSFQKLAKHLHDIQQEFIENNIDLNSSLQSIIIKLDAFLEELPQNGYGEDDLEELKDWRQRIFPDNELDRTIENAGLRPTLQEIVDSIDKSSKTFRTYKERFYRYEQERFNDVQKDLKQFNEFLLLFLQNILGEPFIADSEISDDPVNQPQKLDGLRQLSALFFISNIASEQSEDVLQRTKTPLSQLEQIILNQLILLENELQPQIENGQTLNLRRRIHAFREGFAGRNYTSDLRYYLLFRESIFSKILPFTLLIFFGFLLAVVLSDIMLPEAGQVARLTGWQVHTLNLRNLLIGGWGGFLALLFLTLIPLMLFTGCRWYYDRLRRRRPLHGFHSRTASVRAGGTDSKRLTEIFDDYLADEIEPVAETGDVADAPDSAIALSPALIEVCNAITNRLDYLSEESEAALFQEVKDLGRSFRRFYLRFVLENADVDLAFIPNSVKQSLAVLIRRSKTSAKQAENQIIHLKAEVEAWYDRSMERASGVYRRNAKGVSIAIGIFLAIAVNANSIHILDQLAFEEELRLTLADSASQTLVRAIERDLEATIDAENEADSLANGIAGDELTNVAEAAQILDEFREAVSPTLDQLNLPIGWDPYLIDAEFDCNMPAKGRSKAANRSAAASQNSDEAELSDINDADPWRQLIHACIYDNAGIVSVQSAFDDTVASGSLTTVSRADASTDGTEAATEIPESFFYPTAIASIFLQKPLVGLRYLLGWIITGIAISMGASFWFDLLSKLVKVRNTGKPIATTSDAAETKEASAEKNFLPE